MANKQQNRPKFFIELNEQLKSDGSKTFWEQSPVLDTLPGRTASYVIFRCVGIDVPKYVTDKLKAREQLPDELYGDTPSQDMAEYEFLNAWQADPNLVSLQAEALSFRGMLKSRDFQLWMVDALSKIPLHQWDKARQRFTGGCGNALYIAAYSVWSDVVRGKGAVGALEKLPDGLSPLERYLLSRVFRDYALDEECATLVDGFKKDSEKHGELTLHYSYSRTNDLFGSASKIPQKRRRYGITEEGLEYYKYSATLCGLWCVSLPEPCDDETPTLVLASSLNALIGREQEMIDRLRPSFYSEWMHKKGGSGEDAEEVSAEEAERNKEIAELKSEVQSNLARALVAEKALDKQTKRANAAEEQCAVSKKRIEELEAKLKTAEKKLTTYQSEKQAAVACCSVVSGVEQNDSYKGLELKVDSLSTKLEEALLSIEDLYALLEADDTLEDEYDYNEVIDKSWETEADEFGGRLILYGGAQSWRERVRRWFESNSIKVRAYAPGDDLVGVREGDYLFLNVIGNKHKWSVKCINTARSAGAKIRVCGVNNLEQTLRIIFEKPSR